jgi:antitoxin component YwqK of YwqJK toxin-antitoxin module
MKQRIYKEYRKNGNLREEIHYLGDEEATKENVHSFKFHRTDGPARIYYYENGKIEREYWYVEGKMHRTDGPARIYYYENGKREREHWYVDDKELNEEEIDKLKIMIELRKEVLK